MKKLLIFALLFCSQLSLQAQTDSLNIREVFKLMPDSLLPYLTQNNRLDMIDFMEAKMKAAVDNQLGGESEMTYLSDDSLCIKMNESMTLELKMLRDEQEPIVFMKRTYQITERQKQLGWGKSVVENLSKDIQEEFPGIQGFGARNIWNMARFYAEYQSNEILHPLVAEISWTKHICMITCKSKNRTLQRNAARKSRYRHQS